MRLATISNWASGRSQDRATSCRHCARDGTTTTNLCNCRCAPEVSSPHLFAHEILFPAAARHRAVLAYRLKEDVEQTRAFLSTPAAQARETNSANPQRIPFAPEIPTIENNRALPARRDL